MLHKNSKITELSSEELKSFSGGTWWPTFWGAYLMSEIVNGVQDGLSSDCSEATCCET